MGALKIAFDKRNGTIAAGIWDFVQSYHLGDVFAVQVKRKRKQKERKEEKTEKRKPIETEARRTRDKTHSMC
jgi:hypothetical protein